MMRDKEGNMSGKSVFVVSLLAAFLIVSFVFISVFVATFPVATDLDDKSHYTLNEVHGASMYPTIESGEYVVVMHSSHPSFNFTTGDVVVYRADDVYVGHRVVGQYIEDGTRYVVTKGDNAEGPDEPVIYTDILGKVVDIVEWGHEQWSYDFILNL